MIHNPYEIMRLLAGPGEEEEPGEEEGEDQEEEGFLGAIYAQGDEDVSSQLRAKEGDEVINFFSNLEPTDPEAIVMMAVAGLLIVASIYAAYRYFTSTSKSVIVSSSGNGAMGRQEGDSKKNPQILKFEPDI